MSTITHKTGLIHNWIKRILRLTPTKDRIGRWGERIANKHITSAGLIPVTSNWQNRSGEIDLIALEQRTLVIVEVKTRHISLKSNHPAISAVTREKRWRLESLGRSFIRNHGPFCRRYAIKTRRTDIVEVYYAHSKWRRIKLCDIKWHRGVPL